LIITVVVVVDDVDKDEEDKVVFEETRGRVGENSLFVVLLEMDGSDDDSNDGTDALKEKEEDSGGCGGVAGSRKGDEEIDFIKSFPIPPAVVEANVVDGDTDFIKDDDDDKEEEEEDIAFIFIPLSRDDVNGEEEDDDDENDMGDDTRFNKRSTVSSFTTPP